MKESNTIGTKDRGQNRKWQNESEKQLQSARLHAEKAGPRSGCPFINNVTNRTIEISCGHIYDYKVAYDEFVVLRKERREQQLTTAASGGNRESLLGPRLL